VELSLTGISEPLAGMLQGLDSVPLRDEMLVTQIPSPKGIAPESLALSIEVSHNLSSDHGASRLVFCWDPSQPEGWHSEFRIIGYAKSPVELELAKDDYTAELPWEWLKDALARHGAQFSHEAGTTTTVISTGHGSLVSQHQHAEIEIRASWNPVNRDLTTHLRGWIDLLAMISGLPPTENQVARLA
jgi:hypothetical protein